MNKFLSFLFFFIGEIAIAQSPQQISYQGVARSVSGTLLANTTIAVKFDIHQGSAGGAIVFTEAHQGSNGLTTNSFGLFTTSIGSLNSLNAINWSGGPFFIEVSIDPVNGTTYNSVGTQQFMSVPYALYAEKAGNATPTPTVLINAPNTVSTTSAGVYSITIPASTTYSAGADIDIISGVITNTSPDRVVSISGSGASAVTGSYPNFTIYSPPASAAVTPTITGTGATTVSGTYPSLTINTPASQTYTAGSGISISGGVITNTLPVVTPTITGTGATTVTGTYPSLTINTPASQTYTAGSGISILGGVITNTLPAVTPTITGTGATTVTGTYPSLTINTPASQTYTAGSGISISGGVITNTLPAVTPTITGTGATTVTGTYPSLTINTPASQTYTAGSGISISGGVITNTLPAVTPTITGTGATTVTGTYPSLTINTPASQTYTAGSGISISGGVITNTLPAVTPTITGTGATTVTGTYPSLTINTPASQTYTAGSGINISGGVITNTLPAVTPTITGTGATTVTGTYPSLTINTPASQTYTAGSGISISGGVITNTLPAVTPTLLVNGGTLSGAYPSQTLTIPNSATSLVAGDNILLNQSGSTYTVSSIAPQLTAGSNVTITPVGPSSNYTISAGVINLIGTPGNIAIAGNTVNLAPTGIAPGNYGSGVGNAVSVFSVDDYGRLSSAGQYTPTILGDISGSLNTSVVSKLRGIPVSTLSPAVNQILQYDGTSWKPSALSGNFWSVNGNSAVNATDFIGTTDNNSFVIKTNNLSRAAFTVGNNLNLFMGDNANPGALNLNGNISNSIRVLEVATASVSAGSSLNIMSGDSKSGTVNSYGGTLNLVSGASTGNAGSTIDFATASPVTGGSTRSNPDLKMRLTENGQLLLGNTTAYSANAKLVVLDGHIESTQTTAPSVAAVPALVAASLGSTSTDVVGTVTITTPLAGLLASGNYAKITFNKAYNSLPIVILTPTNANAASIGMYVTNTSLTDFTIAFSQSAALLSSYTFNYIILEGK